MQEYKLIPFWLFLRQFKCWISILGQGGFLAVTVDRENGKPVLAARHYNVDGVLCNEDVSRIK